MEIDHWYKYCRLLLGVKKARFLLSRFVSTVKQEIFTELISPNPAILLPIKVLIIIMNSTPLHAFYIARLMILIHVHTNNSMSESALIMVHTKINSF